MMLRKLIMGSAKLLLRKFIPNLLITRKTEIKHIFPMTYRHERKLKKRKIFRAVCGKPTSNYGRFCLTLSRRRPLSYRNQSIDLRSKSMDWFLYDIGLRHEKVNRKVFHH